MQSDPQSLFDAAMQLPEAQRLTLISKLMDSVPADDNTTSLDDPNLTTELDRRFAEGDEGIPWSQLKSEGR